MKNLGCWDDLDGIGMQSNGNPVLFVEMSDRKTFSSVRPGPGGCIRKQPVGHSMLFDAPIAISFEP
jgi:hypothetical protein